MSNDQLLKPGVYRIPEADYHADPCKTPSASASILKILDTKSARHAWHEHPRLNPAYEPKVATKFDLGSAGHALVLGDETDFEVIQETGYRTNAAKEARDNARANGLIPILQDQWDATRRMADAVFPQLEAHELGNFLKGTTSTVTLVWEEDGVLCRALLDWHYDDEPETALIWGDFKTTSDGANPRGVSRRLIGTGADIQASHYRSGLAAHYGANRKRRFVFLMAETTPPYAVSVVEFSAGAMILADHKRARAMRRWKQCLAENRWPGYSSKVVEIEPTGWAESDENARDVEEGAIKADGRNLLKEAMDWQAPVDIGL